MQFSCPLPKKLGIGEGTRFAVKSHPPDFAATLGPLPLGAEQLARQPVRPLAHVLIGALDEAAMFIATADDPKRARRETEEVLHRLIDAMLDEN